MAMQIIKESRKFIRPSTPTSPSLRQFKIGFTDEFAPDVSVSIVLFFKVDNNNNLKFVSQLEKSLAKILTPLYPLAGRYNKDSHTIDCNDQGAQFIKATCNIKLQVLDFKVNVRLVDKFIPTYLAAYNQETDPLLSIQVTTFACGGIALGVSVSHKIVDASTLGTFLTKWGNMTREENEVEFTRLEFNSPSLFPARGLHPLELGLHASIPDDLLRKYVTLKFSFSESMISNLKEKLVSSQRNGTTKWSKVQLVSALMLKGFIGVDRAIHNYQRDCILLQPINLREKTASPISKDICGNLWGLIATECGNTEMTEELADLLRDSIKKTINKYSKIHHDDEEGKTMVLDSFSQMAKIPPMTNVIWLTSWCRFPFYETDFGFGKPIWASCGSILIGNTIFLMDGTGGNGIEAYVTLEVENVPYFKEALDINVVDASN